MPPHAAESTRPLLIPRSRRDVAGELEQEPDHKPLVFDAVSEAELAPQARLQLRLACVRRVGQPTLAAWLRLPLAPRNWGRGAAVQAKRFSLPDVVSDPRQEVAHAFCRRLLAGSACAQGVQLVWGCARLARRPPRSDYSRMQKHPMSFAINHNTATHTLVREDLEKDRILSLRHGLESESLPQVHVARAFNMDWHAPLDCRSIMHKK